MKYKVGDSVKIKSEEWYRRNASPNGYIWPNGDIEFIPSMAKYLGQTCIIREVNTRSYCLENVPHFWTDYMLEDPIIEDVEFEEVAKPSSDDPYNWLFQLPKEMGDSTYL